MTVSAGEAREVTILCSQLAEFFALVEHLSRREADSLIASAMSLQARLIERNGAGRLIYAGYGLSIGAFESPFEAASRALEIQSALSELRGPGRRMPAARIALHIGRLEAGPGRADSLRQQVTQARRIMDLAQPGHILATRAVMDASRSRISVIPHIAILDHNPVRVPDVGFTRLTEIADTRITYLMAPGSIKPGPPRRKRNSLERFLLQRQPMTRRQLYADAGMLAGIGLLTGVLAALPGPQPPGPGVLIGMFATIAAIHLLLYVRYAFWPALINTWVSLAAGCLAFAAGISLVNSSDAEASLPFCALVFLVAGIALTMLLPALRRAARPPDVGPYCPVCGYCLVGLPEYRCPECGRPFALEELGIPEEQLQLPS